MIQILLVDDQPLIGEGTKLIIEKEENMQVQLETSKESVLELVNCHTYDIILIKLQKLDGIELTKKVVNINPKSKVLLFTNSDYDPNLELLMESAALGFISPTASSEQLIRMIQCAINEEVILPLSWVQEMYHRNRPSGSLGEKREEIPFNEREIKILQELVKGKTNKVISQDLFIGQRTLEYSLTAIFQKLGVHSRVEAVVRVKELGFIDS